MESIVPYLLGFGVKLLLDLAKIKLPGLPTPSPDTADPETVDFLSWLLKVKAGIIKLDDKDKETLKLIKTTLAETEVK